jgi:hypothetical protein
MAVEHGPLSYYTFETPQVFHNFVGQLKPSLRSKETQLIERLSCGFRTICHLTLMAGMVSGDKHQSYDGWCYAVLSDYDYHWTKDTIRVALQISLNIMQ